MEKKSKWQCQQGSRTIKYQIWVQYPFRLCLCGIWSRVLKKWICSYFDHPNHSIIHKRLIKLQDWGRYLKGICTSEALLLNSDKSKGECWRFTRIPGWGCMFDGLPLTSFEIEPQFLMASWWFALHFWDICRWTARFHRGVYGDRSRSSLAVPLAKFGADGD